MLCCFSNDSLRNHNYMKKIPALVTILIIIWLFAFPNAINSQALCSSYLQHYWKMEEINPSVLYDSAGTLNTTATVTTSWVQGKVGFAQSFNGTSEVNIPDDNSFDWSSSSSFTIEFWMNKSVACPAPTTANNNVIIGRDDPSTQLHWWIGVSCTNQGRINFNLIPNNGQGKDLVGKKGVIDGNWHHVVVVRDGLQSLTSIYIDGALDTSVVHTYNDGFSSSVPINLGWLNLTGGYRYNGILDELAIYERALSVAEITDHYNSGNGKSYCSQASTTSTPVKILPLGNSITYDDYSGDVRPAGLRVSYRLELFNKLQTAGYRFDFLGSETAGQDVFPDPENGGFPGITKEQMVTLLQTGFNPRTSIQEVNGSYLSFYQPDVILLHIGTNNLTTDITAINQILDLVDAYRTQSSKTVKLLIAKIINRRTYDAATTQYNTNLQNAVQLRNHPDNVLVDMENGAGINYSTDFIDNLHPNSSGYAKMASLWFSTLSTVLGAPPPLTVPGTPSGLTAVALSETSAQLNWTDNSTNETGFRIERKTGSGAFIQVGQTAAGIKTFTNQGLSAATSYTYRVLAYNNYGNSGYSNPASVETPSQPGVITNLAPGKPSLQSTTAYGGVASRANDNNTNGVWSAASVSNTGNQPSPYWQVDLQSVYNITNIEVWNRTDACCISRMSNFYVFVSDNPFTSSDPLTTVNQQGVWNTLTAAYPNPSTTLAVNRSGRYVRVQLANQGELTIAEVKVFGSGTPPSETAPNAPQGLSAQALSATSAQLNWTDNSTNESGFRVERKTGAGTYAQVAQVAANTTSYLDESLSSATTYTYRVYAYNSAGNSGYSNESTIQTTGGPALTNLAFGKPSSQSATAYGGLASRANDNNTNGVWSAGSVSNTGTLTSPYWQVDLQSVNTITSIEVWNRTDACCISRLSNFYVFVSDNPFTSTNPQTTVNQAGVWNSFNVNYPNPSITLPVNRTGRYVRVQLANLGELSIAEVKVFGSSAPLPDVPNAPTDLTTQAISSTSVQLGWTDNSTNESGFRIERRTGAGAYVQIAQLSANTVSYLNENLTESTTYTYRVYAFNDAGSSGYSNESTVQTTGSPGVTNIAFGKPSLQSSTAYGGVASRANDNNTNGAWSGLSVAHTGNELSPYWQVDLQSVYSITNIEVWNRTDGCCITRLSDFYVFVSDDPFASTNPLNTINQPGVWNSHNTNYPNPNVTLPVNRNGRYIRIQLANQGELNLAELKVFGNIPKISTGELFTDEVDAIEMSVYPNPSNGLINVRLATKEDLHGFIEITDITGRVIARIADGLFPAGINTYNWDGLQHLKSGVYLVRVKTENYYNVEKIMLQK